ERALLDQSAALTTEMRELELRLTQELARERADYEGKLVDVQMQLRALNLEREALRESLASSQAQLESLSRVHEDAIEQFELIRQATEVELAKRDEQMKDQAARVEQLQGSLRAVIQDVEETRRHRDALQIEADRVPQLTNQLEASLVESRRQFHGSPIGILRCSEAGVLRDANRALITTLGYRTVDEVRAL